MSVQLPRGTRTILLIDWASPDVPATLVAAGYDVRSANLVAGTSATYELVAEADAPAPEAAEGVTVYPGPDGRRLVCRRVATLPERADVVVAYRPAGELAAIARHAAVLGAHTLWVEPGRDVPGEARAIARGAGLTVEEGTPIVDAVANAIG